MNPLIKDPDVVRVERGAADESELAAVVLVLLSRLAAGRQPAAEPAGLRPDERWPWWERGGCYRAPCSWHE